MDKILSSLLLLWGLPIIGAAFVGYSTKSRLAALAMMTLAWFGGHIYALENIANGVWLVILDHVILVVGLFFLGRVIWGLFAGKNLRVVRLTNPQGATAASLELVDSLQALPALPPVSAQFDARQLQRLAEKNVKQIN